MIDDDQGGRTGDLLSLRHPHPAEQQPAVSISTTEASIRRYGHVLTGVGLALTVIPLFASLTVAALDPQAVDDEGRVGRVVSIFLFTMLSVGVGMLTVAGLERLTRYNRTLSRQIIGNQGDIRADIEDLRSSMQYNIGLVAAVPGRLDAVQRELDEVKERIKHVPDYGRGVIDGMQVRADALGPDRD